MRWQGRALSVACLLPGVIFAQAKPVLFFGSEHVVIDPSSPAGQEYLQRLSASRPTPISAIPQIKAGTSFGNAKVVTDLGQRTCGDRSDTHLVLCLNEEGRLSYSDSLALLAFASHPTTAYVPDDIVRQYVASLLSRLPAAAQGGSVEIMTAACVAPCTHRITLERRT